MAFVDYKEEERESITLETINSLGRTADEQTARANGLQEELNNERLKSEALQKELDKTKEMNYRLVSRMDVSKEKKSTEELLANMFFNKEEKS